MINWKRYLLLIILFISMAFLCSIFSPLVQRGRGMLLGFLLALWLPLSVFFSRRYAQQPWFVGYGLLLLLLIPLGLITGYLINYMTSLLSQYPQGDEIFLPFPLLNPRQTFIVGTVHVLAFNYIHFMVIRQGLPVKFSYVISQILRVFISAVIVTAIFDMRFFSKFTPLSLLTWLPFYCGCFLLIKIIKPFVAPPLVAGGLAASEDGLEDEK